MFKGQLKKPNEIILEAHTKNPLVLASCPKQSHKHEVMGVFETFLCKTSLRSSCKIFVKIGRVTCGLIDFGYDIIQNRLFHYFSNEVSMQYLSYA